MVQLLDIPDDDGEITDWLEDLLVSRNFGETISQLAFLSGLDGLQKTDGDNLADTAPVTEALKQTIVAHGISPLNTDQRSVLLNNPVVLIELNQRIFETGSDYWMQRIASADAGEDQFLKQVAAVNFGDGDPSQRSSVATEAAEATDTTDLTNVTRLESDSATRPTLGGLTRRQLLTVAASILAVLCGAYLFQNAGSQNDQPWGWQSASALPAGVSSDRYLQSIVDSAEQWFDRDSGSSRQLAANLQSLSAGCQRLIDAPHQPLSADQRTWLIEKCRLWKDDIDRLLINVQAPGVDADKTTLLKNAADDLVSRIALAIKNRAEEI